MKIPDYREAVRFMKEVINEAVPRYHLYDEFEELQAKWVADGLSNKEILIRQLDFLYEGLKKENWPR